MGKVARLEPYQGSSCLLGNSQPDINNNQGKKAESGAIHFAKRK